MQIYKTRPTAEERNRDVIDETVNAGDLQVYKYYIETFGWYNWCLFMLFCSMYGFGVAFPSKLSFYISCTNGLTTYLQMYG